MLLTVSGSGAAAGACAPQDLCAFIVQPTAVTLGFQLTVQSDIDAASLWIHRGGQGSPTWLLVMPHGPAHVLPPIPGGEQQPGVTASV